MDIAIPSTPFPNGGRARVYPSDKQPPLPLPSAGGKQAGNSKETGGAVFARQEIKNWFYQQGRRKSERNGKRRPA
jgi:hypothetical protein